MDQDLTVIQNFNVLPKQSLELLGQRLGLRMKGAELLFCARHYKGRSKSDIGVEELRFIDALACPEHVTLDKIALGELLTDHDYIANTFADAVSKLKALGKAPEKPFTLQDLAHLPAKYTAAVNQREISEPVGFGSSAVQYACRGLGVQIPLESAHGRFDVLKPLLSLPAEQAEYNDTAVLLTPAPDMSVQDYESAAISLLCDGTDYQLHCACDVESESVAHAVLRICSGAVLNLSALPEHLQSPLALATPLTGLLLTLSQKDAPALVQAAEALGLCAYEIGTVDHAGYMIVKCGKQTLLTLEMPYLKSICFIRSYTLRIEDKDDTDPPRALPLCAPAEACDEGCEHSDAILRTLPPMRVRCAAHSDHVSFRPALLCALQAYCTAVAAGCDPRRVWVHAKACHDGQLATSQSAARLLSTLLGLYRFSMELGIPVHTDAALACEQSGVSALASAPSDMVIPSCLQGGGRVYLLAPQSSEDGMPNWSELRALIAYLRHTMMEGKIKSARVLFGCTPADALAQASCGVILNPHGMQVLDTPYTLALLAESDEELEGELIALSAPIESAQNSVNSDNNS